MSSEAGGQLWWLRCVVTSNFSLPCSQPGGCSYRDTSWSRPIFLHLHSYLGTLLSNLVVPMGANVTLKHFSKVSPNLSSPVWNCIPVKSSFGKHGVHPIHEPLAFPGVSSEMYLPDWGEYTCDLKCNRFLREEDAWMPFAFIALLSGDSQFDLGKRGRAGMSAQVISRDPNQILTNRCVLTWWVVWTTAWVTSMRDCI